MLKIERQEQIMNILRKKGTVLVTELSEKFNCSDETIRRDLKELSDLKLLMRTHGGAFLYEKHDKSYPSEIRKMILHDERLRMAKEALKLIDDNDFIFLDSSTTCLKLSECIVESGKSVAIATNSIAIANLLCDTRNEIDLVLLGGILRKHNLSTTGVEGISQINNYFADKCFISSPKISIEYGITDNNINEAKIRRLMIERSEKRVLLMDHTKFIGNATYLVSELNNIDLIITDTQPTSEWKNYSKINNMEFVIAND